MPSMWNCAFPSVKQVTASLHWHVSRSNGSKCKRIVFAYSGYKVNNWVDMTLVLNYYVINYNLKMSYNRMLPENSTFLLMRFFYVYLFLKVKIMR